MALVDLNEGSGCGFRRLRTGIPIDCGQHSDDRGQRLPSTALGAHSAVSVSSLPPACEIFLVVCAGCRRRGRGGARCGTRRSRTASAIVGSTITSCPLIDRGADWSRSSSPRPCRSSTIFEQVAALLRGRRRQPQSSRIRSSTRARLLRRRRVDTVHRRVPGQQCVEQAWHAMVEHRSIVTACLVVRARRQASCTCPCRFCR